MKDMSIYGVKAAVHLAGFPSAEIWRMGGNLEAIAVRLGEEHHVLICSYATESGEWAALLMRKDDEHPIRTDELTPLISLARWQLLFESFEHARKILAATGCESRAFEHANKSAFDVAEEFGWENRGVFEWMEWRLNRTNIEILAEGLRRALANCHCGERE